MCSSFMGTYVLSQIPSLSAGVKRSLGTKGGTGFELPSHTKHLSPQTHIMGTWGAYTNRISGESDVDR